MRISTAQFSRTMSADMMRRQSEMAQIQEQIASGRRINKPSDDPAMAARSLELRQADSQLTQFERNSTFATNRLGLAETALESTANVLMRLKELVIAANTDTLSHEEHLTIHAEVEQHLGELLDYANSRDSNGQYIFAGNLSDVRPFTGREHVEFLGDDEAQRLQIGPGRWVETSLSGMEVFQRIRNGDGNYAVAAGAANSGTALIEFGGVTDRSLAEARDYRLEFSATDQFDIIDDTTGTTLAAGLSYQPGERIEFAGIQLSLSGEAASGDFFTVSASRNQDLFTTVNQFMSALLEDPETPSANLAQRQRMDGFMADLDSALLHINTKRSELGTRQVYIDSSLEENAAVRFHVESTLAEVEGLDYVDAISRLEFQSLSLQTLQQSYSRIENMSLFDYLR